MQPNDLPLVGLPMGLSDEAAAQVLEFLHAFTEAFQRHYAHSLRAHYDTPEHRPRKPATPSPSTDPPF